MPRSAYFKGDGEKVWRDLVRRYGRKRGESVFYALAAKEKLRPGDANNSRPKKR